LKRHHPLFIGLAMIVVLIDQVSKWLVTSYISPHQGLAVIPGFFNLVLVKNRGMAFGILNQTNQGLAPFFLLATTIAAIGVIIFFYWLKRKRVWLTVGLSLILGGAVGNVIDRIQLGYVIDFLDFHLAHYHWPAFNMADSAVTAGTFWLLFNVIRGKGL
jgi:signal peptidase II